jgi:hypothetical protein
MHDTVAVRPQHLHVRVQYALAYDTEHTALKVG